LENAQNQWERTAEEFRQDLGHISRNVVVMIGLKQQYPQMTFALSHDLRMTLKNTEEVIDELDDKIAEAYPPKWGFKM
jgi:hypothetical protein